MGVHHIKPVAHRDTRTLSHSPQSLWRSAWHIGWCAIAIGGKNPLWKAGATDS